MENKDLMKQNFEKCVEYFKSKDLKFDTDENAGNFMIITGTQTDDIPVKLIFEFDVKREIIIVYAPMPFDMEEDKLFDGAVATSMINHSLVDGSFDYDVQDGSIIYRITHKCSSECLVENDIFEYLLMISCVTSDRFNDKLFMISKGAMSIEGLYNFMHEE